MKRGPSYEYTSEKMAESSQCLGRNSPDSRDIQDSGEYSSLNVSKGVGLGMMNHSMPIESDDTGTNILHIKQAITPVCNTVLPSM